MQKNTRAFDNLNKLETFKNLDNKAAITHTTLYVQAAPRIYSSFLKSLTILQPLIVSWEKLQNLNKTALIVDVRIQPYCQLASMQ